MGMNVRSSGKQKTGVTISVALLIVILIAAVYAYRTQKTLQKLRDQEQSISLPPGPSLRPTPTPTPTKLFHGKDTYAISRGSQATGPNITKVTLDPLDPAVGAKQIFTVQITHSYPVTTAFISVRTDTQTTKLPLALISGTAQDGMWQASWTVPETYLYTYIVTPSARSAYDQASVTITIRGRP